MLHIVILSILCLLPTALYSGERERIVEFENNTDLSNDDLAMEFTKLYGRGSIARSSKLLESINLSGPLVTNGSINLAKTNNIKIYKKETSADKREILPAFVNVPYTVPFTKYSLSVEPTTTNHGEASLVARLIKPVSFEECTYLLSQGAPEEVIQCYDSVANISQEVPDVELEAVVEKLRPNSALLKNLIVGGLLSAPAALLIFTFLKAGSVPPAPVVAGAVFPFIQNPIA